MHTVEHRWTHTHTTHVLAGAAIEFQHLFISIYIYSFNVMEFFVWKKKYDYEGTKIEFGLHGWMIDLFDTLMDSIIQLIKNQISSIYLTIDLFNVLKLDIGRGCGCQFWITANFFQLNNEWLCYWPLNSRAFHCSNIIDTNQHPSNSALNWSPIWIEPLKWILVFFTRDSFKTNIHST